VPSWRTDAGMVYSEKTMRPREPNDFYPSPYKLCKAAVGLLRSYTHNRVLDPGAGTGNWGGAARERWGPRLATIAGVELDPRPQPVWSRKGAYDTWYEEDT
jgi:predicted TPR repeat methyltransferase